MPCYKTDESNDKPFGLNMPMEDLVKLRRRTRAASCGVFILK
jgi:hypothetical protein